MKSKTKAVGIIGSGRCLPDRVLTNVDLQNMVDTSDEWITTRTGIKQRRISDENTATSDIATGAALRAMEDAGITAKDLDLIIVATATPDMLFPSTACIVQSNLGAVNAAAFDIEAACTGFIYGLSVGEKFVSSGDAKNVLVIGAETLSKLVDWEDRSTCVLFGDGAGAVSSEQSGRPNRHTDEHSGGRRLEGKCLDTAGRRVEDAGHPPDC
jgi:3-oxoacyl-[acyl-carrier-protein] synthase-3